MIVTSHCSTHLLVWKIPPLEVPICLRSGKVKDTIELREEVLDTCLAVAAVREDGVDRGAREATFVITDPSLDSYGEIIDAGAFDKQNPQETSLIALSDSCRYIETTQ